MAGLERVIRGDREVKTLWSKVIGRYSNGG